MFKMKNLLLWFGFSFSVAWGSKLSDSTSLDYCFGKENSSFPCPKGQFSDKNQHNQTSPDETDEKITVMYRNQHNETFSDERDEKITDMYRNQHNPTFSSESDENIITIMYSNQHQPTSSNEGDEKTVTDIYRNQHQLTFSNGSDEIITEIYRNQHKPTFSSVSDEKIITDMHSNQHDLMFSNRSDEKIITNMHSNQHDLTFSSVSDEWTVTDIYRIQHQPTFSNRSDEEIVTETQPNISTHHELTFSHKSDENIVTDMDEHITKVKKFKANIEKGLEILKEISVHQYEDKTVANDIKIISAFATLIENIKNDVLPFFPNFFLSQITTLLNKFPNGLKKYHEVWKRSNYTHIDLNEFVNIIYSDLFIELAPLLDFGLVLGKSELTPEIKHKILNANYSIAERGDYTAKLISPEDRMTFLPQLTSRISRLKNNTKSMVILPTISDMFNDVETIQDLKFLFNITKKFFKLPSHSNGTITCAKAVFKAVRATNEPILLKISEKFFTIFFNRVVDNIDLIMIDVVNLKDSGTSYLPELKQLIFDFMAKHGYMFFRPYSSGKYIYDPFEIKQDLKAIVKTLQRIFMEKMLEKLTLFQQKFFNL